MPALADKISRTEFGFTLGRGGSISAEGKDLVTCPKAVDPDDLKSCLSQPRLRTGVLK